MVYFDPQYQCTPCKIKHRGDEKKQRKSQERKGCFEVTMHPRSYLPRYNMMGTPKIIFGRCPAYYAYRGINGLIEDHNHIEKGQYPYPGTYREQPAKFDEIMGILSNLIREKETGDQNKAKRLNRGRK